MKSRGELGNAQSRGAVPGQPSALDAGQLAEHQKFADSLADRAVHLLRGTAPSLTRSLDVAIVDDDAGGPYSIPPRDVFHKTLKDSGFRVARGVAPGRATQLCLSMPSRGPGRAAPTWCHFAGASQAARA